MTHDPLRPTTADALMTWHDFEMLTTRQLHDVLKLRCDVFVVEQASAYPDIDGLDLSARHLLATAPGNDALIGYLRIQPPVEASSPAKIGRVVVARAARGTGLGRRMLLEALAEIRRRHGDVPVALSAQVVQEPFYRSLGFARTSADYDDGGIAHCDMTLQRPG